MVLVREEIEKSTQKLKLVQHLDKKDELYKNLSLDFASFISEDIKKREDIINLTAPTLEKGEDFSLLLSAKGFGGAKSHKGVHALALKVDESLEPIVFEQGYENDFFVDTAKAKWTNGLFFRSPKSEKTNGSLSIVLDGENEIIRNQIIFSESSQTNFLFTTKKPKKSKKTITYTEVILKKNAQVNFQFLQDLEIHSSAMNRFFFQIEEGASLQLTMLGSSGVGYQSRVLVSLEGENANFDFCSGIKGSKEEQHDYSVEVYHRAAKSNSSTKVFHVLADKAKANFQGLIQIEKNISNCEAHQKSRTLLLNKGAVVNAIPKLIIKNDVVACSHGASISKIDDNQMFYLMSRGLSQEMAEQLVIRAFLEPLLGRFQNSSYVGKILENWGLSSYYEGEDA
ncbi:MAG: SufD family Fe-S cluster assembly protein [Oligoflexia bacterium]|nr:SufD family Fe-S cluster assembly protein [Oligoflexia bacterium]